MKETLQKSGSLSAELSSLYEVMRDENLEELEIKDGETHVQIRRRGKSPAVMNTATTVGVAPAPVMAPIAPVVPSLVEAVAVGDTVKSPIIGVFYRSSSPGVAAFVNEGDVVNMGKTLCIVEAMKVMNEIKADTRMKIVKLLVENGKPITAGQDLL